MNSRIGISIGDVTGIGPEVTLKALLSTAQSNDLRYLLLGDPTHLCTLNERLGLNLPLDQFTGQLDTAARYLVHNPSQPLPANLEAGAPEASRAAVAWLSHAAQRCLRGEIAAMVTAPVNKEAIIRSGISFIGQTEFLSELANAQRTAMMLLGHDAQNRWLRVILATTHVPIRQLASQITKAKVELAIELAAQACRDLGLPRQRVAVCGLNPHAGEGGKMGTEEGEFIAPAIAAAAAKGLNAEGPFAADALFYYVLRGDYDAVVAMYHDQGLVALKMIGFETGVNWTLGLPFIRTSPDHGTAYNIAGTGQANPSSMCSAITLAAQLARHKQRQSSQ